MVGYLLGFGIRSSVHSDEVLSRVPADVTGHLAALPSPVVVGFPVRRGVVGKSGSQ